MQKVQDNLIKNLYLHLESNKNKGENKCNH